MKFEINKLRWPITFFSTAFGAGVFYLPQSVGPGVSSPVKFIMMSVICALISFCVHYQLYKFIQSSKKKMMLDAIEINYGPKIAKAICFLFLLSMISIALINFMTIVNLLVPNENNSIITRFALSFAVCLVLCFSWLKFDKDIAMFISKISILTIIAIIVLAILFLNLKGGTLAANTSNQFLTAMFPILLFVFNFSPSIQRFAQQPTIQKSKIAALSIGTGVLIILIFIFLFCFCLSHVLNAGDYLSLRNNNLDALSFASHKSGLFIVKLISILAILLATIGAYVGTLTGIVDSLTSFGFERRGLSVLSIFILSVLVATVNFSILKTISFISLPIITLTVFFIPSIYFLRNKQNVLISSIVLLSGIVALSSVIF
ncbi:hypothetical protein LMA04_15085 [Pseudescherichia vulneris]|uniref:hypothetical protein n=1 Tax=Pseudescherichia vulneris TaxID=566 RepID=UPI00227B297A|nr:hypothetical protein [Pseudescherichia vulneris]WAH51429.1 hypothetical protein LMA04_15085 [Pseudescherichia vulneris]